ncbi:MAG: hypothetical protein ACRCZF_13515, partial [Gemmataceae bacterium]
MDGWVLYTLGGMNFCTLRWFLAAAFAIAHTQSPVGYSNQNQYLLHGLAQGQVSPLAADWLANTADPTPIFSGLVSLLAWVPGALHAAFFVTLMIYADRLLMLARTLRPDLTPAALATLMSFSTLVHAGITRYAVDRLFGADYAWFLQCGLANQYLLGPGWQPSTFGVMLLAAVVAFLQGRYALAGALAGGVCLLHGTYLLPAGFLVLSLLEVLREQRQWRAFWHLALPALAFALPVIGFYLVRFGPTDPESFHQAQTLLATLRIPHHCVPRRWWDNAALFQVLWMVLGIVVVRRSRLGGAMRGGFVLGGLGTLLVLVWPHPSLMLLFPWRLSALLVPLSTLVILLPLARRLAQPWLAGVLFMVGVGGAGLVTTLQ